MSVRKSTVNCVEYVKNVMSLGQIYSGVCLWFYKLFSQKLVKLLERPIGVSVVNFAFCLICTFLGFSSVSLYSRVLRNRVVQIQSETKSILNLSIIEIFPFKSTLNYKKYYVCEKISSCVCLWFYKLFSQKIVKLLRRPTGVSVVNFRFCIIYTFLRFSSVHWSHVL